ncbi:MAG: DUF58 domain-containing protein [Bowdeniella nasicola]|nr:DUF58 domain-containing protein [Bowdeniella nasicola]
MSAPLGEASTSTARPSLLHVGQAFTAVLLAGFAVILSRPELAALAALAALDLARPSARRLIVNRPRPRGVDGSIEGVIEIAGDGALPDAIQVRLAGVSGVDRSAVLAAQPSGAAWSARLHFADTCGRTGGLDMARTEVRVSSSRSALGPLQLAPLRVFVPPRATALPPLPAPRRLVGAWGPREDRRPGQGTRFFDVAPMGPGDRMARISWRATARHATGTDLDQLFAARAHAGAEAVVLIALDPRDDVGPNVDTWAGGIRRTATEITSLDVARNAALSLANAHLEAGDRVGLLDLAVPGSGVPPSTGRRAKERFSQYVSAARAPHHAPPTVRAPRVPTGATIWLISTFLDAAAADVALTWARSGHQVWAVDVLPEGLRSNDPAVRMALALELAERDIRIRRLREAGLTILPWRRLDEPDLAHLRTMARQEARR